MTPEEHKKKIARLEKIQKEVNTIISEFRVEKDNIYSTLGAASWQMNDGFSKVLSSIRQRVPR